MFNTQTSIDYKSRREKLLQAQDKKDAVIIIPAAPIAHRNSDMDYVYRQDSDFYYLTGFEEPESVMVLSYKNDKPHLTLFNLPRDPLKETWTGKRAGQEGAREKFGADEAYPISEFADKLPGLLAEKSQILFPLSRPNTDQKIKKTILKQIERLDDNIQVGLQNPLSIVDISPCIGVMRQTKDDAEIERMRTAVNISEQAHLKAMNRVEPDLNEIQLEAELMHTYLDNGSHGPAYPNIVASGENACILHYTENNRQIKDGELVLIDAAAEYGNYAADITRTFPANGKFSPEQRTIYDLVLKAQEAGIKEVYPGSNWNKVSDAAAKVITQGLLDLGLLKGNLDELLEQKAYTPFYMHGIGHWLGLDTHDVGPYFLGDRKHRATFQPGMVLTVEPGIYISPTIPNVPPKWHNIGIRIEDDILVTPTGNEVLSSHLPKKPDEIESLLSEAATKRNTNALTTTAKLSAVLGQRILSPTEAKGHKDTSTQTDSINSAKSLVKSNSVLNFADWQTPQSEKSIEETVQLDEVKSANRMRA